MSIDYPEYQSRPWTGFYPLRAKQCFSCESIEFNQLSSAVLPMPRIRLWRPISFVSSAVYLYLCYLFELVQISFLRIDLTLVACEVI